MKNPLRKRIPRELKGEFGKYLVVFILMVTTIGMVSGFLVADGSMIQAYNEGFEKYNIEDGNFRTGERLYRGQREAIEEKGVKVYENYYIEDTLTNGSTMRFFKNRTDVNKVCLMEGKLAEKTGEIAIDRMYADNNELKVGDTIDDGEKSWKITGLVALSDYSCLFQNNSDTMFDSVKFGVGVVTEEEFDTLNQDKLQYNYAWIYNEKPQTELEEKEVSEDLMKAMGKVVTLESFVPQYQNQAIIFTGDDMGSDKAMIAMIKKYDVLEGGMPRCLRQHEDDQILAFEKKGCVFVFNFHPTRSQTGLFVPVPENGDYQVVLSTDDKVFGGYQNIDKTVIYHTWAHDPQMGDGFVIYLPARTAVVLRKVEKKKD